MLDAYDSGELDAVIAAAEGSRRGGEKLTRTSSAGSRPSASYGRARYAALATLAPPCGVLALAVRALDKAGIAGPRALSAAESPRWCCRARGPAVGTTRPPHRAAGADRVRPRAQIAAARHIKSDSAFEVSDPAKLAALRTLAATFRSMVSTA